MWLSVIPYGDVLVRLSIIPCWKSVPPIIRSSSPHLSHNLLPLSVIVPLTCFPVILSLSVLSLPTRSLKS